MWQPLLDDISHLPGMNRYGANKRMIVFEELKRLRPDLAIPGIAALEKTDFTPEELRDLRTGVCDAIRPYTNDGVVGHVWKGITGLIDQDKG
ncbi:MAG: hypothetical protein J4432_02065 [DPANN group archaeon]|nr:hypothetical protein [DPANN group archaeon]